MPPWAFVFMAFSNTQRSLVFIDGPNLYHKIKDLGLTPRYYSPVAIARKLVQDRPLVQIRYYRANVGENAPRRVRDAYQAMTNMLAADPAVAIVEGYLQRLPKQNPCAKELLQTLATLPDRLPQASYAVLYKLAKKHHDLIDYHEKGVDVQLAIDMVRYAVENTYDLAYLLSGDGDFSPAVETARTFGKRVFVASPDASKKLRDSADLSIRLHRDWFDDCQV